MYIAFENFYKIIVHRSEGPPGGKHSDTDVGQSLK